MSAPTDPPAGLRERKKIKLRRTIQAEALRLFETQGYEQTTVEQIAEAAETSTTTFYRYFPTKEDVVLDDDYDPIIEATIASRPAGEALTDTFRAAAAAVAAATETDQDNNLARLSLIGQSPALDARYAGEERRSIDLIARLLADRTGRTAGDYQVQLTAAAVIAVLFTASRRWAADRGSVPLRTLVDQAVTTVEPLLAAIERSARSED
ncbi:MAG: TetR/AcrR family transcriptional regulator [Streptosporangiaceae bacterium]